MQTFNDESMILDVFRDVSIKDIALFGNFLKCKRIHHSLTGIFNRKKWIDSSGKSDPPPDFYNNHHKLMMDVMRIDDHAYVDEKGKVQNKTLQHEGELYKKYFNYPDRKDLKLFMVADTGLPSDEDHNFDRYYKNFERVFKEHEKKIDLYRSNHPGFKTIFFIFDESTAYAEAINLDDVKRKRVKGCITAAKPHFFCSDKKFVNLIKESIVDYVVWYAPWKMLQIDNGNVFPLPKCAIYDVKNLADKDLIEYNHSMMFSSEE